MPKPYVLPLISYLVGATIVGALPSEFYAVAYSVMVVVVAIASWTWLRGKKIVVPHWRILEAVVVGLVGIALWIFLCKLHLELLVTQYLPGWLRPASRVSFNPFEELSAPWEIYTFITFRMIGLSFLVPVVEEVFWRGFLMRWFISDDWEEVELGRFTWPSFWGVVGLFTLAHPEWLAAATYCALISGLFYWKKDIWSCIVAHGVSNFAMGIYVLVTGTWWLW